MAAYRSKNSSSNKRTYKYLKDYGNDLTYENEVDKLLEQQAEAMEQQAEPLVNPDDRF